MPIAFYAMLGGRRHQDDLPVIGRPRRDRSRNKAQRRARKGHR